jgi:hypothetical protein
MCIFLWLLNLIKNTHLTIYRFEHRVKLDKLLTILVRRQLQNIFFVNNIAINMITMIISSISVASSSLTNTSS